MEPRILLSVYPISSEELERFLTCHHEAAHAVLAYHSRYHRTPEVIEISSNTHGVAHIGLSKAKLQANAIGLQNPYENKTVAVEKAVILFASRFAEEQFLKISKKSGNQLIANPTAWKQDFADAEAVLRMASVGAWGKFRARWTARCAVRRHWIQIEIVAEALAQSPESNLYGHEIERVLMNLGKASE